MKLQGSGQNLQSLKENKGKPLDSFNFDSSIDWFSFVFYYLCDPFELFRNKGSITHKAPKVSAGAERQQGVTVNRYSMPKVKTNSSAKKRFKVTGTGKITHQKSFKRHILTKKSKKRKRALNKDGLVHKSNLDFVKRLLRLK